MTQGGQRIHSLPMTGGPFDLAADPLQRLCGRRLWLGQVQYYGLALGGGADFQRMQGHVEH